jgi:hypothetical protein
MFCVGRLTGGVHSVRALCARVGTLAAQARTRAAPGSDGCCKPAVSPAARLVLWPSGAVGSDRRGVVTSCAALDDRSDHLGDDSILGLHVVGVAPLDAPHSRDQPMARRDVELVVRVPHLRGALSLSSTRRWRNCSIMLARCSSIASTNSLYALMRGWRGRIDATGRCCQRLLHRRRRDGCRSRWCRWSARVPAVSRSEARASAATV